MSIGLVAVWILVGWCGTPPRPWPWPDPPKPSPDPWIMKAIGVIGGLIGGFAIEKYFGIIVTEGMTALNVVTTGIGAYVGSYFLGDMYSLFKAPRKQ